MSEPNDTNDSMAVDNTDAPEAEKKRSFFSICMEIFIYLILIFVCIYVVPKYVVQRTRVDGPSMKQTLHNGESLLINKISYRFHDPERYDIIVFYPNGDTSGSYYVKRIYGLPGETVSISDNNIYINGTVIEDPYASNPTDGKDFEDESYTLSDDEYFVLGDNREESLDNREMTYDMVKDKIRKQKKKELKAQGIKGDDLDSMLEEEMQDEKDVRAGNYEPVRRKDVVGKVWLRVWPLSRFGIPQ